MEENREQPTMEPANVINITEEERAVSEVGSQGAYGKFKSADKLLEAYNNLESEFTKKCQLLSQLQKDKGQKEIEKSPSAQVDEREQAKQEVDWQGASEEQSDTPTNEELQDELSAFLLANDDAKPFEEEIKKQISSSKQQSPYEVAWANVVLGHLNSEQKTSDPIVNKYVLSDENVRKQVIQEYLNDLAKHKPPQVISSTGGERVSSISHDTPTSLAEAKEMVRNMFDGN